MLFASSFIEIQPDIYCARHLSGHGQETWLIAWLRWWRVRGGVVEEESEGVVEEEREEVVRIEAVEVAAADSE